MQKRMISLVTPFVVGIMARLFATNTREYWLTRLREVGVPAGAVNTIEEALHSPETRARGMVTQIPHPTAGSVPNVAFPMRFRDTPVFMVVYPPI